MIFRLSIILGLSLAANVDATIYELESKSDSVIGQMDSVVVGRDTTLLDIARKYGFGFHDIKLLNPTIDTWMPNDGAVVHLPSQFILPNVPRNGIVLNIPEMRLYYFPKKKKGEPQKIITYPLGVGREGWATPYKQTRVIGKKEHPDWRPPKSIRQDHEEAGDPLPEIVKAGPDNPLGDHALRLGLPSYLIHGTNKPWGIGMRVSHGCIRLYPEDIAELFDQVMVGTPVNIINKPYKIGKADGVLYLEVHPPLTTVTRDEFGNVIEPEDKEVVDNFAQIIKMIVASTNDDEYLIDWDTAKIVSSEAKGIPVAIGMHIPQQEESKSYAVVTDGFYLVSDTNISNVEVDGGSQ